jgi:hypothetical protein
MSIAAGFDSTQIEAMAVAAKNAGMALGRDLGDAFDRITKGVTKAEPELLDELGIILRLETASKKYAKTVVNLDGSIGKSVKELTTYEKQQAVLNEVITQAESKFGLLGKAMEGKANSLSAISAALTDTALTAGNYALDFKILGLASLKDVVKFFSENATAVMAAFAGLAMFLLKNMIPTVGKFTNQYSKAAQSFAADSHAMAVAAKNSGTTFQSFGLEMDKLDTGSAFITTIEAIGINVTDMESTVVGKFDNITNAYRGMVNQAKKSGGNFGAELENLKNVAGPEMANALAGNLTDDYISKFDMSDEMRGTGSVQKAMSDSLLKTVSKEIDHLNDTGRRVGRIVDKGMGLDMEITRRGLKDLRMQMLKTANPKLYAKELDEMKSAVSKAMTPEFGRKFERWKRTGMALKAMKKGFMAEGKSEIQGAFQHEGTSAGWEESRYQAKRYGEQVDKLYKEQKKRMGVWGTITKKVGQANLAVGSQIASVGRGIMSGGMKAMQAIAMYTMAEAAVKGIAKSFGLITTKIPKAISGMKAFGEELEAQQDKWIGYRNQLGLFTESLEGIGKAAGQEAQSLESFSNSLASASIKWGQAFEDMTGWEKAGEAFSWLVPWQDSMSETLEEQTKKFAESIKKSGHLKAIADELEIDTADMKLFDDKGKTTAKLALFQEEVKKSAKFARNLESGIKDLGLAFQGTGDAHSEFAKSLLTSTKFDAMVEQSKGLKKTFDAVFYSTEGVAAFEGTLDKAATAVKEFKDDLGNLSLEVQLIPTNLGNMTAAELKKIAGFQSQLIGMEGITDPLEAIKHNSALNYKIQESVSESNRERQQKHVVSQVTGSLLPELKRTAFSHIPEAEWEEIAKRVIKGVEERIQNAATVVMPDPSDQYSAAAGLVQAIPTSVLQNIVKDVVGQNITVDMIKQGIYQNAISSQVDDLSIELTSAMETLIGKHEGYLSLLHEGITDGLSFTAAKGVLKDAIKKYDDFVKNAQRQFRYLQGEIDLLSSSMTRLKNTGTSIDLLKSLNVESKILDSKQDQIRLTIKTLKLSKQTEEIVEAIAQEEAKIADMQLNRLSLTEILHKSITSEMKYQYDLYEKNVGLISQMASTLESIGAINKSQVAHLNFVSTKQTSINSAAKDLLDLHAKYQRDLVTPGADKGKLLDNYTATSKAIGEQLEDTIKIAKIERDSSYLEHKLELYNKMLDRASALLDVHSELLGIHDANASTTEALSIISTKELDLSKARLESSRETTELTERYTLAIQNAVGSTTDLTKWYKLEKAHMSFMITTREKLISLQALASLNTLRESSFLESTNRHLTAQEELNNSKLTSSIHVNNIKARENRLANIKKKFDVKALQHEHNVLKIKDKLENLELTSWERQNLLRDISSEILEMEKEKVEVLEEYVEGLKAAHEAKKRVGEASLDDELYYRIQEMQEAMPSAIDSAANVMIGSISTAVDMMAANIKEGEGAFGAGGFEDFAAKQWQAAGDTLIDSAAEKMKVASAKLMLGSNYVSPEEKAVQALKKQDIGNNYLLDIATILKTIRDKRTDISNEIGTTTSGIKEAGVSNRKVFDELAPDNMSKLLNDALQKAQDTRNRIATGVETLVDLMKPAFELQRLAAEKAASLAAAEVAADKRLENEFTAAEKQFEDLDKEYADNWWFDLQIKGSNELTKQIRLTVEAQYREVAARERYIDTVREMTTAMTEFVDASLFDKFRNSDAYKGIVQEAPPHLLEKTKYRALPTDGDSSNPTWQDRDDNNRGAEFYAHGGHVSGSGGPTDDSVAAWLSNGEFVVNADATKRNRAFLNIINEGGKIPGFYEGTRPDSFIGGGIFDAVDPQVTRILNEVAGHVLTISTLLKDQVGSSVQAIDDLSRELVFDLVSVIEFELGIPMGEFMHFVTTEMSPTLDKLNITLDTINKEYISAAETYKTITTPSDWFSPSEWFSDPNSQPHDKFAAGGWVSGPGGPKEDKIPAMLSNGEYVINAASTKKYEPLIRSINEGTLGLAEGGMPSMPSGRNGLPKTSNLMLWDQLRGNNTFGMVDRTPWFTTVTEWLRDLFSNTSGAEGFGGDNPWDVNLKFAEGGIAKFSGGDKVTDQYGRNIKINEKVIRAIFEGNSRFTKGVTFIDQAPGGVGSLGELSASHKDSTIRSKMSYALDKTGTKLTYVSMEAPKGGPNSLVVLNKFLTDHPGVKSVAPFDTTPGEIKNYSGLAKPKLTGGGAQAMMNWRALASLHGAVIPESLTEIKAREKIEKKLNPKGGGGFGTRELWKGLGKFSAAGVTYMLYEKIMDALMRAKGMYNQLIGEPEELAHGGKVGKVGNAENFVRGMDWNIMGWEDDVIPKDPMGLHKYGFSSTSSGKHDLNDRLKLSFAGLDPDAMANHAPFFFLGNTVGTDPVFALRGRKRENSIRGVAEQNWKDGKFQQLATYFSSIEGDMVKTMAHETGHFHPSAQISPKEAFGDKIDISWFKFLAGRENGNGGTKGDNISHAFTYPDNQIAKELIVRSRAEMAVSPMGTSIKDLTPNWLEEHYTKEMWESLADVSMPKKRDYDMERILKTVSGKGRNGDTELAHVNPFESILLRSLGGSADINPRTGLREYAQAGAKVPTVKTKSKVQEDLLTMISKMTEEQAETLKKQLEYFQNTFRFQKGELNEEQKNWKSFNESDAVKSFENATGVSAQALVQSFGASFEMELGNLFKTGKFDVKSMLSTFATSVSVAFMNSATAMAVDYVDGLGRDLFSSFLGGEGKDKGSIGPSKSIAQLEADDYNRAQKSQNVKPGHKDYWGSMMSVERTTDQLDADDYLEEMNLFEDKGILGDIKEWGTGIMDSVGDIFGDIKGGAGGIWDKISGFGKGLMKGIGNIFTGENGDGGLMGMLSSGGSWLTGIIGDAGSWLSGLFSPTALAKGGYAEFAAGGAAKQGYARFSDGGAIHGAGGPTADAIPAWLSNGEYVINASSTARYRPIIEAINADELAKGGFARFARGGFPEYTKYAAGGISDTMAPGPDMAAIKPIPQGSMGKTEVSNNVSVNVNVTNGGASVDVDSDSGNELTQEQSKALGLMIGQKIQEQLIDEQRPGGILSEY